MSARHAHTNALIHEASPYLLQHAHNPVDWMPWGDAAFEAAASEDKPVFLSVGYAACHWCHVMERESFENDSIAEFLNRNFVSIKVDREERPDVDHHYMEAVQAISGHGGWPMSVFLTPDRKPFYAGTYWPAESKFGRPGFLEVLQSVLQAWRSHRSEIDSSADAIHASLSDARKFDVAAGKIRPELFDAAVRSAEDRFDSVFGGFGGAPKFPHSMELTLLLRIAARDDNEKARAMAIHSLRKMAAGGLHDQLGGGFHRYSTDARWLVPHFEKMLYDNALLATLYFQAAQISGDGEFATVGRACLDWALREMEMPEGGFASALDADSEGEEGKFYVWSPSEVKSLLGDETGTRFCSIYDISDTGNFENGQSVPNLPIPVSDWARRLDRPPTELDLELRSSRSRLISERAKRVRPFRDEKVLADWNGFMLTALAAGFAESGNDAYLRSARKLAERFLNHFERVGKLPHSLMGDRVHEVQLLLDYSAMGCGLLDLFMADGDARWLDGSLALARKLDSLFSQGDGLYRLGTEGIGDSRPIDPYDNAMPSGIALAGNLHARLYCLTGDDWFREHAEKQVNSLAGFIERAPAAFAQSLITVDLLLYPPPTLVVVGDRGRMMYDIATSYRGRDLLTVWTAASSIPATGSWSALARLTAAKFAIDGKPTAYLCRDFSCELPATSPESLRAQLMETH